MIRVYNTMSGQLEEFKTVEEGKVKMYVCGPTVYNYIHIGNARPIIFFDTVRRYLEYRGYDVKYVSNFTDVDDKIINKANEEGVTIDEIVKRYIAAFLEDTAKLNLKEEGMIRPKATENIGEMIKMIKELESKGYAYAVDGDVYFEVEKYEDYAALSHHNIEDLKSGARIDIDTRKKSPVDFALWKSAKEGEPFWNSPWGKGRPGWHIECSAMSKKYLGDSFDIHGGGQDLIFPHHENEIAQSKCSHGGEYGRYWMHNGYLNIRGEKMSKSSGNFFTLRDILKDYDGNMIRFFMLSSHYRKPIDFSDEELEMAKTAIERIENTILRAEEVLKETPTDVTENLQEISEFLETSKKKFEDGMDDDFNTAIAIGTVFEMVKEINRFIDLTQKSKEGLQVLRNSVEFIKQIVIDVLGIKLNLEMKVEGLSNELVELILDLRMNAKKDKNFALADDIRNRLSNLGIEIKDGKDKTAWTLKR
ncbi:MAG: cysteine--tRNA ligase [Fusobacteriaceae bacterium]|nr:cysteine--tRNA ligase [Fusobacteriaceae bacterium]